MGGVTNNSVIQNNQITQTSPTVKGVFGILANVARTNYDAIGNIVSNQGTLLSTDAGYFGGAGVGIEFANNSGVGAAQRPTFMKFNVVHDNGYNNNNCGGADGIETFHSALTTIENNEIYNEGTSTTSGCDTGGIDGDINTVNVIQYNYTHNNWGYGFQCYSGGAAPHNCIQRFNISQNDGRGDGAGNGFTGGTGTVEQFYNNTIYMSAAGIYTFGVQFEGFSGAACPDNTTGSTISNNIFDIAKNNSNGSSMMIDWQNLNCNGGNIYRNNLYFSNTSNSATNPGWKINNVQTATFSTWEANSGEVGGINGSDPLLSSPGTGGTCGSTTGPQSCPSAYTLTTGSPACDAGFNLTAAPYNQTITQDYYGNSLPTGRGTGYPIGAAAATCP